MNERKTTIGDSQECECPSCGKMICLQDPNSDGCLKPGYEDVCEHCGAKFRVTDVDYDVTVWMEEVKP